MKEWRRLRKTETSSLGMVKTGETEDEGRDTTRTHKPTKRKPLRDNNTNGDRDGKRLVIKSRRFDQGTTKWRTESLKRSSSSVVSSQVDSHSREREINEQEQKDEEEILFSSNCSISFPLVTHRRLRTFSFLELKTKGRRDYHDSRRIKETQRRNK